MRRAQQPIGVLLAGGAGRRLGGDKARVALSGRPLAQWALDALAEVFEEVVVACRLDSELPSLRGVSEAWVERDGPRGPVAGLTSALRAASGRAIVACSINLPLITTDVLGALLRHRGAADAVVPDVGGRIQPLVGLWEPAARPVLAALPPTAALVTAARAVDAAGVPFDGDAEEFTCVHAPEDLLRAAALLDLRRPPHLRLLA